MDPTNAAEILAILKDEAYFSQMVERSITMSKLMLSFFATVSVVSLIYGGDPDDGLTVSILILLVVISASISAIAGVDLMYPEAAVIKDLF